MSWTHCVAFHSIPHWSNQIIGEFGKKAWHELGQLVRITAICEAVPSRLSQRSWPGRAVALSGVPTPLPSVQPTYSFFFSMALSRAPVSKITGKMKAFHPGVSLIRSAMSAGRQSVRLKLNRS